MWSVKGTVGDGGGDGQVVAVEGRRWQVMVIQVVQAAVADGNMRKGREGKGFSKLRAAGSSDQPKPWRRDLTIR